jgi:hypothetical protein
MFVSTCLLGQNKELQMVKIDSDVTWRNSTLAERESFYFNLPVVKNSDFHTHIRISFTGQVIDFFSNDNIHFEGILTNEITQYKLTKTEWGKSKQASKIVFQKLSLDPILSSSVAKQILETGQDSIPTDSLLPSWYKWYHHCGNIEFQVKYNGKYVNQSFHCPWSQPDTARFLDIILANNNLISNKFELEKRYDEFQALLVKGKTYSRNDYMMLYLMTDREYKAWKKAKPKRDYWKTITGAIDSSIRAEIAKQNIQAYENECFEEYWLTFGKRGKLKKIKVAAHDKPKISDGLGFYVEEKREIGNCKKMIKQMFREIDLSSFDLEYNLTRTLRFMPEGEIHLSDKR